MRRASMNARVLTATCDWNSIKATISELQGVMRTFDQELIFVYGRDGYRSHIEFPRLISKT